MVDFMQASSVPTLIEFSEDYIEPIFGQRQAALFLFSSKTDSDKSFAQVFRQASQELKGQILFVTSGVSEGIQQRLGEFIGVEQGELPTIRLLDPAEGMRKFAYAGQIESLTVDNIRQFIQDFKDKKLQPFLKSEEIPAESSDP